MTGVRSRTHLLYAATYLRRRIEAGVELDLHYVDGGRFLNARVEQHEVRAWVPDGADLRFVTMEQATRVPGDLTYLSVGVPGLKPWLRLRAADPRRTVKVVVSDEGLGSYGDLRTRRAAYLRQSGLPAPAASTWSWIRSTAVTTGNRVLTDERYPLYRKADGWSVDPRGRAEFERALKSRSDPAADPSGRAVFLSQPWPELGLIDEKAYLAHVELVRRAMDARGLELSVRPHPAEVPGRYDDIAAVLPADFPAELDPLVVDAALVIGASSTALLNLAALYGTPVVRTMPEQVSSLELALGADQKALLATYTPPPVPVETL